MSEVEPLSPAGLPPSIAAAAPSSGGSLVLDTNPYQSVFANSLSNGNRNNVAILQQKQQYRDAAVVSPNTSSK